VRVNGEEVIDRNILSPSLNVNSDCEDALLIILGLIEHPGNILAPLSQSSNNSQQIVVSSGALLEIMHGKFASALVVFSKKADFRVGIISVHGNGLQIHRPLVIFKPAEIFGEPTNSSGVLFPTQHGLICWEAMVGELFATAFYFHPIYRSFL